MTDAIPTGRPRAVTFVVVLTYISAVLNILGGIFLVIFAGNTQAQSAVGAGRGVLVAFGIFSIIVGVITLLVARGLRHGSRVARMVVTIVMGLQAVGALVALTTGMATAGLPSSSERRV